MSTFCEKEAKFHDSLQKDNNRA